MLSDDKFFAVQDENSLLLSSPLYFQICFKMVVNLCSVSFAAIISLGDCLYGSRTMRKNDTLKISVTRQLYENLNPFCFFLFNRNSHQYWVLVSSAHR